MARSKFKGPLIFPINGLDPTKKTTLIYKHAHILPEYVDHLFTVYNGKKGVLLKITEPMIGHRFGEFISTRANYQFKKKKKNK